MATQPIENPVVVTRHPTLVDYLRERGIISGECAVKAQVAPEDIAGRHVVGVLPLLLAALCAAVTVVDLEVPLALRGAELTLEQLREFARSVTTYHVRVIS